MKNTNIFKYATSEYSQDAFICFFVAHASENSEITPISRQFIDIILKSKGFSLKNNSKIEIKKQYKKIDVLVIVDDIYIIIEDKTTTNTHNNQILRYKQALNDENIPENKIISVYYKIQEQVHKEENIDIEFNRKSIIKLLNNCKTQNQILVDYLEYLTYLDNEAEKYKVLPINVWNSLQYYAFFDVLKENIPDKFYYSYKYQSNKSGGFMCFYIQNIVNSPRTGDSFYIQIENSQIVLKYYSENKENSIYRAKLLEYFKKSIGDECKHKIQRKGRYMSVCHIDYDFENHLEKLELMIETLENCNLLDVVYDGSL